MVHSPGHIQYCRDHYANSHCEQGCDSAPCGWDGSDCFTNQRAQWAKGTLVLHTKIPHQRNGFSNSSLFWALSVLLQTPVKLRASAPMTTNRNLFDFDPSQLASMLTQTPPADSDGYLNRYIFIQLNIIHITTFHIEIGVIIHSFVFLPVSCSSLLFLQVDNRPCSRLQTTCFPYATEAASFLRAITMLRRPSFPTLPELTTVISVRGVQEEIGGRDEETDTEKVKGELTRSVSCSDQLRHEC